VIAEVVGADAGREGSTLFGIADKFGLELQTIHWSDLEVFQSDPHVLRPGMQLAIVVPDGSAKKRDSGLS